jgi:ribosomal protein L12E/L44/L45/RPP1/RPP2
MKLKLKGLQFDTIEEIQVELQRLLDALTEKDFQEVFQKMEEMVGPVSTCGGIYFEGDGGQWALL